MLKKQQVAFSEPLYGLSIVLCFFAFMLTEALINERCAVVLGSGAVNAVYSFDLVCTGAGFLSFPLLRKICKAEKSRKAVFFLFYKWRTCDLQKGAIYRYHKDMQTIDMEEMQMFKKVMAIVLALPMLLCLAACRKENTPAGAAGDQSGAPGAALAGDASAGTEGAASAPFEKEKRLDELAAETNPANKYEELIAARDI